MDEILETIGQIEQGQAGSMDVVSGLMNPYCIAEELQFAEIQRHVRARLGAILSDKPPGASGDVVHPQVRENFQIILQNQMQFQGRMK